MQLRPATPADLPTLAVIYRESARVLAAPAYSPAQIEAWASWPDDFDEFQRRLLAGVGLVSLVDDQIAAFGQLHPDDYLALLYTAPALARRGHASALVQRLEAIARERDVTRLDTIASHLSRPLFAKLGFADIETERTIFKGVEFERFKMSKSLVAN